MADTSMRVLLVSPLPPPVGGIATWTRILVRELAAHPEVHMAHLDTAVRWRPVTQVSRATRLLGGTAQALRDYLRFRSMLSRNRPDVVHICTSAGYALRKDMLMLRAASTRGARAIVHFHMGRIPALSQGKSGEWELLRLLAEGASAAVVLDGSSRRILAQACPRARVCSLPNMVDLPAIDGAVGRIEPMDGGDDTIGLVYVGHVLPSKGVTDLVDACRETGERLALDVVGPVEDAYRRDLATRAGDRVTLRFHGTLSHEAALGIIRRGHVFALPSHTEGFPNVVAEAMACSRPVAASDVGAIPEMLAVDGPEPCGICVEAKNVTALAGAIRTLAREPDLRRAMGARGRRRAEAEYAAPVVTQKVANLWRETAGRMGWQCSMAK